MVGANQQPLAILRLLNLDRLFANDTGLTASAPVAGRQELTLGARVA